MQDSVSLEHISQLLSLGEENLNLITQDHLKNIYSWIENNSNQINDKIGFYNLINELMQFDLDLAIENSNLITNLLLNFSNESNL